MKKKLTSLAVLGFTFLMPSTSGLAGGPIHSGDPKSTPKSMQDTLVEVGHTQMLMADFLNPEKACDPSTSSRPKKFKISQKFLNMIEVFAVEEGATEHISNRLSQLEIKPNSFGADLKQSADAYLHTLKILNETLADLKNREVNTTDEKVMQLFKDLSGQQSLFLSNLSKSIFRAMDTRFFRDSNMPHSKRPELPLAENPIWLRARNGQRIEFESLYLKATLNRLNRLQLETPSPVVASTETRLGRAVHSAETFFHTAQSHSPPARKSETAPHAKGRLACAVTSAVACVAAEVTRAEEALKHEMNAAFKKHSPTPEEQ